MDQCTKGVYDIVTMAIRYAKLFRSKKERDHLKETKTRADNWQVVDNEQECVSPTPLLLSHINLFNPTEKSPQTNSIKI